MDQQIKNLIIPAAFGLTAAIFTLTASAQRLSEVQMDRVTAGLTDTTFAFNDSFVASAAAKGTTFVEATAEVGTDSALATASAISLGADSAMAASLSETISLNIQPQVDPQVDSAPEELLPEVVRSSPVIRDSRGRVTGVQDRSITRR